MLLKHKIYIFISFVRLGRIQATAKKVLVPKIKSMVEDGAAYQNENVLVTHNDPKYKTTGTDSSLI